jgi:hypothetical protein
MRQAVKASSVGREIVAVVMAEKVLLSPIDLKKMPQQSGCDSAKGARGGFCGGR